jgi:hypothetical protein
LGEGVALGVGAGVAAGAIAAGLGIGVAQAGQTLTTGALGAPTNAAEPFPGAAGATAPFWVTLAFWPQPIAEITMASEAQAKGYLANDMTSASKFTIRARRHTRAELQLGPFIANLTYLV